MAVMRTPSSSSSSHHPSYSWILHLSYIVMNFFGIIIGNECNKSTIDLNKSKRMRRRGGSNNRISVMFYHDLDVGNHIILFSSLFCDRSNDGK
mmetsp:Transcript_18654/g.26923  ORF Transcript_18654/g.26923 Transcript_18654/m.26923 type:complete len:93 (-) Transcript_18654:383-661(-)